MVRGRISMLRAPPGPSAQNRPLHERHAPRKRHRDPTSARQNCSGTEKHGKDKGGGGVERRAFPPPSFRSSSERHCGIVRGRGGGGLASLRPGILVRRHLVPPPPRTLTHTTKTGQMRPGREQQLATCPPPPGLIRPAAAGAATHHPPAKRGVRFTHTFVSIAHVRGRREAHAQADPRSPPRVPLSPPFPHTHHLSPPPHTCHRNVRPAEQPLHIPLPALIHHENRPAPLIPASSRRNSKARTTRQFSSQPRVAVGYEYRSHTIQSSYPMQVYKQENKG